MKRTAQNIMRATIMAIAFALSALPVSGQSFTFEFNERDFTLTKTGDTVSVACGNPEFVYPTGTGMPDLPMMPKTMLNPMGKQVSDFNVSCTKKLIAQNVVMKAVGAPVADSENSGSDDAGNSLTQRSVTEPVNLSTAMSTHHGYGFSHWLLSPFLYDAERQELYFVSRVSLTAEFADAPVYPGVMPLPLKPHKLDFTDVLMSEAAENSYAVAKRSAKAVSASKRIDYLIIAQNSFVNSLKDFVRWKTEKGLNVKVASLEEIYASNSEKKNWLKIKRYIYDMYVNNDLSTVLIIGDGRQVPAAKISFLIERDSIVSSDAFYACLGGSFDWDANGNGKLGESDDNVNFKHELSIGRIPETEEGGRGQENVKRYLKKVIDYEKSGVPDSIVSRVLLGGAMGGDDKEEPVGTKSTRHARGIRLHEKYLKPYGVSGTFIYDTTEDLKFVTEDLTSELSKGYHIFYADCHGNNVGLYANDKLVLETGDFNKIKNETPFIVLTTACRTNLYADNKSELFSNEFIKGNGGRAIAYIASSGYGLRISEFVEPRLSSRYCGVFCDLLYSNTANPMKNRLGTLHADAIDNVVNYRTSQEDPEAVKYLFFGITAMGDPDLSIPSRAMKRINASMRCVDGLTSVSADISGLSMTIYSKDSLNTLIHRTSDFSGSGLYSLTRPCVITLSGMNCIPAQLEPTEFGELYLDNITIDSDRTYKARKITVGKNVTIKEGVSLTLNYTESLRIKEKVWGLPRAKLYIRHVE